jgi:hypothetical protein
MNSSSPLDHIIYDETKESVNYYTVFSDIELKLLQDDNINITETQSNHAPQTVNEVTCNKKVMIILVKHNTYIITDNIHYVLLIGKDKCNINLILPDNVIDGHQIIIKTACNNHIMLKDVSKNRTHILSPGAVYNYVYSSIVGWIDFTA